MRVLGFVGNDLIYGFGNSEDTWIVNGRVKGLPMYAMHIVDNEMNIQSEYKKENVYISDVKAEDDSKGLFPGVSRLWWRALSWKFQKFPEISRRQFPWPMVKWAL